MNHTELLEDTAKFYSEDTSRRALNEHGDCCYLTKDGKKCAIGRHILEGEYNERYEDNSADYVISHGEFMFPDWICQLNFLFLNRLQKFHDECCNWEENGLTSRGKNILDSLRKEAAMLDS
jgi:hypothetical protein